MSTLVSSSTHTPHAKQAGLALGKEASVRSGAARAPTRGRVIFRRATNRRLAALTIGL